MFSLFVSRQAFLSIEQMSCWILDKIQEAESLVEQSQFLQPAQLQCIRTVCSIAIFNSEFLKPYIAHYLALCKHNPSLSGKVSWPAVSCWLSLACEACLAHGWHVWHATAGSFLIAQRVRDWQAMFLMSPAPETAITPRGCFHSPGPVPLAAQREGQVWPISHWPKGGA